MLARRVGELPDGPGWIFEPKWDGFRVLVFRDGGGLAEVADRLARARERLLHRLLGLGAVAEQVIGDAVALARGRGGELGQEPATGVGTGDHV